MQMTNDEVQQYIMNMPDEVATRFMRQPSNSAYDEASYYKRRRDEDGFTIQMPDTIKKISSKYKWLQQECWNKFSDNPQVRTAVLDAVGRVAGYGFSMSSEHEAIQNTIFTIDEDPRNRLHTNLPKYYARSDIEGELFLVFTVHEDGFVEIDFRDPGTVGGAYTNSGILSLKRKPTMPLVYCFDAGVDMDGNSVEKEQIPSIFVARYPELLTQLQAEAPRGLDMEMLSAHKSTKKKFAPFGHFFRFVVPWDKGFMTTRNVSHLRTVLKWVNLYESLKMYEIDHKRSSGAYLWAVEFEDLPSYKLWCSLTEEQKKESGLLRPKAPGGTLIVPPGAKLKAHNPTLPKISDSDTDILSMMVSGLNTTTSMAMGSENSTYASAQANKGPMADRSKDSMEWWSRFLRHDLWDSIFFIQSKMGVLKYEYKVKRCVGFKAKQPIMRNVMVPSRHLMEFSFPSSELVNLDVLTAAFLGVKHGALTDALGIPRSEICKRLGLGNYSRLRQVAATEDEAFPELVDPMDQEQAQEKTNNAQTATDN